METLTVIFNHLPKEQMLKHYNYHKEIMSNVRVVWDIKDLPKETFEDPKDPNIMVMELDNLWANLHKYYTYCLSWFGREHPNYFILMERDVAIVSKNFEKKIINYMKEYDITVCFPWINSRWNNAGHPFNEGLQGIEAKQWTIPALTVIKWEALQYYGQSLVHLPDYWGEIRFPTVLAQAGMQVVPNPFVSHAYFGPPDKTVPPEKRSMPKERIAKAIQEGWLALHPIKDYDLLDFIKEQANEKNTIKEISFP